MKTLIRIIIAIACTVVSLKLIQMLFDYLHKTYAGHYIESEIDIYT